MAEIAEALLARPEVASRAKVIINQVAELLPGTAAVVYIIADQEKRGWKSQATAREIEVGEVMDFNAGTLGAVAEGRELQVFEGSSLQREDFSHLDIRRTVVSLAYAPLLMDETLVGAIELVGFEQPFPENGAAIAERDSKISLAGDRWCSELRKRAQRQLPVHLAG